MDRTPWPFRSERQSELRRARRWPTLIEAKVTRRRGHYAGDRQYRPRTISRIIAAHRRVEAHSGDAVERLSQAEP
jgi:TPP-dependent pyruvate/acetoin dehydrogenase alpha subunit